LPQSPHQKELDVLDRRAFLKSTGALLGTVGAGGFLAACGNLGANGTGIPRSEATWILRTASFPEMLVGEQQRFAFSLTTEDNVPVEESRLEVYTRLPDGDVTGGPYAVEYHTNGPLGLGVYLTRVDLPEPGFHQIVAAEGDDHGFSTVQVVRPEDSQAPAPGAQAVSTRTPTPNDPMDFADICTRNPDCDLHEQSLDEILAQGRPLLVMFATPAFCTTAVCGPSVDTFIEVSEDRDWGDLAFLHVEIFTDEGFTAAQPVLDWGLPSEPWLFAVDSHGVITDRLDGLMLKDELIDLAAALT
jgi:hypothetical protein